MSHPVTRPGFSLLEIIAAVTISAVVAMVGLTYVRRNGADATTRACAAHRATLQTDAELFQREQGRWPTATLAELISPDYHGERLPTCPTSGASYRLDRGIVTCPTHAN